MGVFISENIFDFGITEVENIFITNFMLQADGVAIKTYLLGLYALRHKIEDEKMSNKVIANKLGVGVDDIIRAWKFWESLGLVNIANYTKENTEFDVIYKPISKLECAKSSLLNENKLSSQLDFYEDNIEYRKLARHVEDCLQRPLQPSERKNLFEFVDELNIGFDLVKLAFQYAASKGKLNRRGRWTYVYTMLESWKDNNIQTIEEAENHLQQRTAKYKFANEIEKITGTSGATFIFIDMIDKWQSSYDYSPAMIENVCKFLRKTRQKLVPAQIDAYFEKLYTSNVKSRQDFATYISAGEEAYLLMKETGLWISADDMRACLEKWKSNYKYDFETIRDILLEYKQNNNIYKLKLDEARSTLQQAFKNGIKNVEDYKKYIAVQTENQNTSKTHKTQYRASTKQSQFTKFKQREKRDISSLITTARELKEGREVK